MRKAVIVVAGGSGKRMGSELPKQFLSVNEKPILMHTLSNLYSFDNDMVIVLVMLENSVNLWQQLCERYKFNVPHILAYGGKERFYSVKNGLLAIPAELAQDIDVVAVHDGVRPFVTHSFLNSLFSAASDGFASIPVLPLVDSIREYCDDFSVAVDRKKYCRVQTPQCFPFKKLLNAYCNIDYSAEITDDASVWERFFPEEKILLVPGDERNIKITNPIDIAVAEYTINNLL